MEDLPKLSLFSGYLPFMLCDSLIRQLSQHTGSSPFRGSARACYNLGKHTKLGVGWGAKENGPDVRLPRLYVTVLDDLPRSPHENPLVPPAGWHRRQTHMPSRGIWVCSIKMVIALYSIARQPTAELDPHLPMRTRYDGSLQESLPKAQSRCCPLG